MTNNSPFDDHIKKRLADYEPAVPAHIWENIMAGKEKRRPGGFLFDMAGNRLAFILVILALSAGGSLLVHTINNNNSNKNTLAGNETVSTKTIIKDENYTSNNVSAVSKNQIKNNDDNTADKERPVATHQNIASNTANVIAPGSGENTAAKTTANYDMPGIPNDNKKADVAKKNSNLADNKTNINTSAIQKTFKTKATGLTVANDSNDANETTDQLTAKNKKINRSAAQTNMTMISPGADAAETNDAITDVTTVSKNNKEVSLEKYYLRLNPLLPGKEFSFSVKNINGSALNIPCPIAEKNTAGNKRYFEIYGGPDYVFRTFNDTANSTYLQKRKESTHFSSAFSVGIRYTKVFNNAMSFRTGINYSQVNEKFKYEQYHMVQQVYIIDNNGDTTGSYATTGTRYKTTHNRYRTIDVPLTLGYEMGNGRLHTNINAGLVVNIYSWQKGDILDNNYKPVDITTGTSSSPYQFKTNIGIGFMGGVSFYYKLTERLHILAEPYFRYNFSAANKSDITLKQKYTTAGLRFGLRIDF